MRRFVDFFLRGFLVYYFVAVISVIFVLASAAGPANVSAVSNVFVSKDGTRAQAILLSMVDSACQGGYVAIHTEIPAGKIERFCWKPVNDGVRTVAIRLYLPGSSASDKDYFVELDIKSFILPRM